uniref:WRKY19-like zinc finger domain-containing protein n=1 Tax=Globisporangium ultimum (strain ATCC 200006 / CBS 805.95 / DAOM BR144) TaxID=431595 RepID=K3WTS3_GLOUD
MEWGNKSSSYQVPSLLNLTPQRQQQSQYCSHQFDDDDEQARLCKVEHEEDDPQDSIVLTRPNSNGNAYFADRYPGADGGGSGFVSGHSRHLTDAPPFGFPSSATALPHYQSMQGSTASMAAMEGLHGCNNSNAHFTSAHVLDLQNFDDSASVDLQQLFPQPPVGAAMMSTNSTLQALHQSQQLAPYYATAAAAQGHHQTPSTEFFSENFQSPFHADPSQGGLPPFSFSSNNQTQQPSSSMFDDRDEMVMPEMHEVSNLFGNASLMTPPMSTITPRTSIVSPMNGGFLPPRSAAIGAGNNAIAPCAANNGAMTMMREGIDDSSMTVETSPKFSPDRRKLCCIEGCKSQARAFNRCKRHGGSKRCSHPGCTKSVQSRGLCIRHGGGSRCQESGCTRAAQSHGRCKMHGGGRPCIVAGCEKKAHLKRLCRKHGGGAKCYLEDCDKWAQRQGMCMAHSKHASPTTTSRGASLRTKKDTSAAASTTDTMEMMTQL